LRNMVEKRIKRENIETPVSFGPKRSFTEKVRAKDTKGTVHRLWIYLKGQKKGLILVFIFVALTTLFGLLGPYLMGRAIDQHILKGDLAGLARISLVMLAAYLITALTTWFQTYIMASVAQKAVLEIRNDLFAKLQTLSLRFFDKKPHGELMSRISNDVDNISNVLNESVVQFISAILTVISVAIAMFMINVRLAIVSLVTIPLIMILTKTISKHTRKGYRDQQARLGELNSIVEETITGERVIKAYGQEYAAIESFEEANLKLKEAAIRAQNFMVIPGPIMNFLNNISFGIIACAGGYFAIKGAASVGNIAAFISYSRHFGRPLNQIANLYNTVQSAIAGAERVFEIIDEIPELTNMEGAIPLIDVKGDVIFDNVSFAYDKDHSILKNVSLHAKPGQTIALVGPTGAGKTTIVNLLTRFYDIDEGGIYIDGSSISEVQKDSLRSHLGIVLQDTYLFTESVMENIRYGRLEASDEEVIKAAKLADAHGFIHRLPQGYETKLSERGDNISQGQRQLLAIARAILADPRILILDEATSSVDTRTEINIQKALLRLMKDRTSFVIAHRLSTIRDADEVLVINNGAIIERGTHDSLLSQQGFYHSMYISQFKGHKGEIRI
jgi:ATP-binding cassette, subfamily B, multidrug efflux pump